MRVLVTGGAGFIGSHLCRRLLARGAEVLCVDNLVTGRMENLRDLEPNPRFELVRHDITRPFRPEKTVDFVLHFASPASPMDYQRLPIQTLKVGSLGTFNALGIAKDQGAKFLLASTSEVYGDPQAHPQPESYWGHVNPVGARGCYDEAKRFAEAATMAYHRTHKVDTRIVRIFNTYGPFMRTDDGRAIPNFITQALAGKPLTLYGDGSQTRSFCYISDLVAGLEALMGVSDPNPVNLGSDREMPLKELAETVLRLTGGRGRIVHRPLPKDDPKVRRPDLKRARRLLGWRPQVGLEEGLRVTLDWFRSAPSSVSP